MFISLLDCSNKTIDFSKRWGYNKHMREGDEKVVVTKDKVNLISDTIHGSIQFSEIEKNIISTPIFNRLHNISQNSTAYMTFPTNRTKRFEHSVGVMHLAGKMFYASLANGEDEVVSSFFEMLRTQVNKRIDHVLDENPSLYRHELGDQNLRSDILKGYDKYIFKDCMKNRWIPANIKENDRFLYLTIMQSIRLAALLHDVGHPPFSHIAENAFKKVWYELSDKSLEDRTSREQEFYDTLAAYFEDGELHEKIGNTIVARLLSGLIEPIPKKLEEDTDALAGQLYLIFIKEFTTAILDDIGDVPIFKNIHSLISGSLDCDRLDYVTRDMTNSGFSNGQIEYERLIATMKLMRNENDEYVFCPSIKALSIIEDFFNRRWMLYNKIIFHHRVIKTDYLLEDCIVRLIRIYLSSNDKPEVKSSVLPYNISGLWMAVRGEPSNSKFFNQLIQWDDNWLMVVLKKEYYELPDCNDNWLMKKQLHELIANNKYYFSVIKDSNDFHVLENSLVEQMKKCVSEIKEYIDAISHVSNKSNGDSLSLKPFLEDLEQMINYIENHSSNFCSKGFLISKIHDLIFSNYMTAELFEELVRDSANEAAKTVDNIKNIIVVFKPIKTGVQESLTIYSFPEKTLKFKDISSTATLLLFQRAFLPPFYVYVGKKDLEVQVEYKTLKQNIGRQLGQKIVFELKKVLEKNI